MLNKTHEAKAGATKSGPNRRHFWLLVCGGLTFVVTLFGLTWLQVQNDSSKDGARYVTALVDWQNFKLEVADTPQARTKGLGGHTGLKDDEGMLFVFDEPGIECFWMKDVSFSIDILWFDADKKLIHKLAGLAPESYPQPFCPSAPAQYVIELAAGTAKQKSLDVGDSLQITDKQ